MSQRNTVKEKERTIGNYTLGKTIGEGTFGKVRLGIHQPTSEKVAVKILEKDKIQEQADVERVAKEIQILKMLRHTNIIQLYEIIETPKELFLIMEYANGGELFDFIVANTRVKEREACRFFQQIIAGVEYIHKIGVVHRDLKPENLLLDQQQNIKIVDFGLSNTYKPGENLKTACGSPCYAAPEMIAGKRYSGLLVDIWSCGVIMFALICGYLPFEDPNTSQLYKKIIAGDFQIPKYISAEGRDLLKCILNTDPNKRYTIQQIRDHPWYRQIPPYEDVRGIVVGVDQIKPDESLVEHLKMQFSIDPAQSRKMVINNRHNNVTTLYYLTMQKHKRSGKKFVLRTEEDQPPLTPQQAQQGQQIQPAKLKVERVEPTNRDPPAPSEEAPINTVPQIYHNRIEMPKEEPLMPQLQREVIVKPKVHIPPMKLTFNPITQAVNNSISSVGTNTTTTPLATARKLKEETSVDDKKQKPHTDRNVERPFDMLEMSLRNALGSKVKTDNQGPEYRMEQGPLGSIHYSAQSPIQFVGKSVSQHTEPSSYQNDLVKRSYQGPSLRYAQADTPTYSQGKNPSKPPGNPANQMQTINMSYFVQNKATEQSDGQTDSVLHNSNKSANHNLRSPQLSGRNKYYAPTHKHSSKANNQQSSSTYQSSRTSNANEVKVHKGAFNLKCVSSKPPQTLMDDLVKSLQLFQVTFEQRSRYELICQSRESTKFEMGVYLLQKSEGLYLLRGRLLSGDASLYQMYSHNIIQTMNM